MKTSVLITVLFLMVVVPSSRVVLADDLDEDDCMGCAKHWHSKDDKCIRPFINNSLTPNQAAAELAKSGAFLIDFDDEEDTHHAKGSLMEKAPGPVASPQFQVVYLGMQVTRDSNSQVNGCKRADGAPCSLQNSAIKWCAANEYFSGSPQEPKQGASNANYNCAVWVFNDQTCGCMALISCSDSTFNQYSLGYFGYYRRNDKAPRPTSNMVCDAGYSLYRGQCHKPMPGPFNDYTSAKAAALADNATLASCHSHEEFLAISGILAKSMPKPPKSPTAVACYYFGIGYTRDQTTGQITKCDNDDQSPMDFGDAKKKGACKCDFPYGNGKQYNTGVCEPKDNINYTRSFLSKNDQLGCRLAAGPPSGTPGGCMAKKQAKCPSAGQIADCNFVCH